MNHRIPSKPRCAAVLGVVMSVTLLTVSCGSGEEAGAPPRATTSGKASAPDRMTGEQLRRHVRALQEIADSKGGNRAGSSPGYTASMDYVAKQLTAAGFRVTRQKVTATETPHKGRQTSNVVAELTGKTDPSQVMMAGAHLDSVSKGPGINDNGTGVAALLEFAQSLKRDGLRPDRTVRLAFWGDEEEGLLGSAGYLRNLSERDRKALTAYVNVDMLGTRGGKAYVMDGENSSLDDQPKELQEELKKDPVPPRGSATVEKLLTDALKQRGIPIVKDLMGYRATDSAGFSQAGVPTGNVSMATMQTKEDGTLDSLRVITKRVTLSTMSTGS
ncbi:M20/M25/M40 family metallo-hydrolase [Streptomyces sp. NPDC002851]